MPFEIVREDITKMKADAIVNAANTDLLMGGGVCGAIFAAAGASELQKACDKLAPIATGEAVITPGFNLQAKFIIHAPGIHSRPRWRST
ncbi:MAG: macro domain-containing protein [Synergistaceae bacterium]|jgi:O-acetyl-ADP-ribose deacetylase (regulator of RNase III)|nr:macro domain-containing protein [Synergistaceae bacterium]